MLQLGETEMFSEVFSGSQRLGNKTTMLFKTKLKMLFKHEFWPAGEITAKSREVGKE